MKKIVIRRSPIQGLGMFAVGQTHVGEAVFAARSFKSGEVVTKFKGPRIHESKVPKQYVGKNDRYMQIERDYYLGPSGGVDDIINHSCNPNTGLKFTPTGILLVAIRNIKPGDEITWDYSSTLLGSSWKMKCDCRENNCRKIIGDFTLLDKRIQQKYLCLGIVPKHIKDYMENSEHTVYTKTMRSLKHAQVA